MNIEIIRLYTHQKKFFFFVVLLTILLHLLSRFSLLIFPITNKDILCIETVKKEEDYYFIEYARLFLCGEDN